MPPIPVMTISDVPPIMGLLFVLTGVWGVLLFIFPSWARGLTPRWLRNDWWLREDWRIRLLSALLAAFGFTVGILALAGIL